MNTATASILGGVKQLKSLKLSSIEIDPCSNAIGNYND